MQRRRHAALLMRPVPAGSIAPPQQWLVCASRATNSLEEANRLGLQNDCARTRLPVDAEGPRLLVEVADRGRDQFAITRAGQEAGSQKVSEFFVGGFSKSARQRLVRLNL